MAQLSYAILIGAFLLGRYYRGGQFQASARIQRRESVFLVELLNPPVFSVNNDECTCAIFCTFSDVFHGIQQKSTSKMLLLVLLINGKSPYQPRRDRKWHIILFSLLS